MTKQRYEMSIIGSFHLKIDHEEQRMFVMPKNKHKWYIPYSSQFKYKLRSGVFTEILIEMSDNGLPVLIPKHYIIKEPLSVKKKH